MLVFTALQANAGNGNEANPLLVHSNAPIVFDKLSAPIIRNAVDELIKISDARIEKIAGVTAGSQTEANTLFAFDELFYDLSDLGIKLQLIGVTYVDDSTRNAANDEAGKLGLYSNNLLLNEKLYKALKIFSESSVAKSMAPNHKKFLNETIVAFEKNGMKLDANGKAQLTMLNEKLINYGIEFDKNIAESKDSIAFSETDLAGVPEAAKAPWKRTNGKYVVRINGPNATEVLADADNDDTRHTMYIHYNNRAYPKNITVLDSLFYYRQQFAALLGFRSYAAYALVDKMAASPENVWNFENDLVQKLTPHVTEELTELKALKQQLHLPNADVINDWDINYLKKKLLDTKYQLNTDEVKQYFEMNNTINGMFSVYEKLFSIQIKETKNIPVWFDKVTTYDMYKDGKKIGSFYLDLYPRPNKYTHFACFPINQYSKINGKEVLPVSALICNFPEGNASEPSLLNHIDVITMFHEFGHLVHSMLGRSDLAMQGPFYVKGDFTEAPSQFLENWCWEYESLKMLAKNYKTGETLPKSLFDKMKQTQLVGSGMYYMRQVYLGMLDFTYEDKYNSAKNILDISKALYSIRQMPFPDGAHFICSFTHLNGYAANYYGYLWSRVFAEDMFSVFEQNGVMDIKTGLRYRHDILEAASTKQEIDMLRDFLGRDPNSNAFLKSIGVQ